VEADRIENATGTKKNYFRPSVKQKGMSYWLEFLGL
jgi:hypothetical protein